jgi:hypothetical protein
MDLNYSSEEVSEFMREGRKFFQEQADYAISQLDSGDYSREKLVALWAEQINSLYLLNPNQLAAEALVGRMIAVENRRAELFREEMEGL